MQLDDKGIGGGNTKNERENPQTVNSYKTVYSHLKMETLQYRFEKGTLYISIYSYGGGVGVDNVQLWCYKSGYC